MQKTLKDTMLRVCEGESRASSDQDLLALVIQSDEAARTLLATHGNLFELARLSPDLLGSSPGMTSRKAAVLTAAMELGRRTIAPREPRQRLRYGIEVDRYFRPMLANLQNEEFWVACLDIRNHLLRAAKVAQGGFASCAILPREVFAPAISTGSVATVLVHNHPSGEPMPSADDLQLTARLVRAGEVLGIRVLDHVIVGNPEYYSLLEHDQLK